MALAGVAQLVEHPPRKGKVASLVPHQGTGLGCTFRPWSGCVREVLINVSLLHPSIFLTLSFSLSCLLSKI